MSWRRSSLLALILATGAATPHAVAAPEASEPAHDLIPAPRRIEWRQGRLVLDDRFSIAVGGARDARVDAALERTRVRLRALTGLSLVSHTSAAAGATLTLSAQGPGLPIQSVAEDESYELSVTPRGARLTAPNPLGILHGLETFLQLVSEEGGRHFVPAVTISDRPRFPWRGLLIDPCRRWQPVEVIERNLDAMAAVKLNVLHWHLSEDQGFRVESKVFPKLHEQGSDGLYYTQDEIRHVVDYARERGIRVVPEFDVPGHATSWLVGYPELGSAAGPFSLVRTWGIFDNALDPTRDEVYAFLDGLLGEMAALFPDAYLHIGGDEVTPRQWNANARILDFMYRNDLDTAADLQAHFNRRVNAILARHGKRMVGWDEILRPELPKSIVVQSWRGAEALAQAAELGYEGILSHGYYLDHMLTAADHYLNDPIPPASTLAPEARQRILGGEACMWGEFVSPETIDSRIWPRTAAIAERLWSPAELRDVDDMYRRLELQSRRLEATGVRHRSGYEPMLERLTGGQPTQSLRLLADLVQPVKFYRRGQLRAYTSATPLDRLVDAARPESWAARRFRLEVDRLLETAPASRDDSELRRRLAAWRDNHPVLEPILAASPLGAEARPLSRNLSALGGVGLQALDVLAAGPQASAEWLEEALAVVDRAQIVHASVELMVVPAVRKLVLAAAHTDELETLSPEEWSRRLDERVRAAAQPDAEH